MTRDELARDFKHFGEVEIVTARTGRVIISVSADFETKQAVHEAENYASLAVAVGGEMHLDATPGTGAVRITVSKEATT